MSAAAPICSFCPETALFHNLCVSLHMRLCGVKYYASALLFGFLDLVKNCWFPDQKRASAVIWGALETALFHNLCVSLHMRLCGVKHYASALLFGFLDLVENCWFPDQKRASAVIYTLTPCWGQLTDNAGPVRCYRA